MYVPENQVSGLDCESIISASLSVKTLNSTPLMGIGKVWQDSFNIVLGIGRIDIAITLKYKDRKPKELS
jgi:hypothetical protein